MSSTAPKQGASSTSGPPSPLPGASTPTTAAAASPNPPHDAAVPVPSQEAPGKVSLEYYDPYDDWSSRDTLLGLIPTIMAFALQDGAFHVGMIIAVVASAFLLVMRTVAWDSRYKKVWPILELTSLPLYVILLGTSYPYLYQVNKWFPTITSLTFLVTTLVSMVWRRPWTAHYARYPKFDRGGALLLSHQKRPQAAGDLPWFKAEDLPRLPDRAKLFRKVSYLQLSSFASAFAVMTLFSLIPQLTGHHQGSHALNIIFNYMYPLGMMAEAVMCTQLYGSIFVKGTLEDMDRYYGRPPVSVVPGAGVYYAYVAQRTVLGGGGGVAGAGRQGSSAGAAGGGDSGAAGAAQPPGSEV